LKENGKLRGTGPYWLFPRPIRISALAKSPRSVFLYVTRLRRGIAFVLLGLCLNLGARAVQAEVFPEQQQLTEQQLQQLTDKQQWQQITLLLAAARPRTAAMDFYYGMALAHLDRLAEAEKVLKEGRELAPAEERFSLELAGISFKQKHYAEAERWLRLATRLAPNDAYANNFLGTVYYLEDNLPAALKYWNHVQKPEIAEVREEPPSRLSPVLLDHAFAFSPASTLLLPQLYDTEARLRGLGIFPRFYLSLSARTDGKFDVVFRNSELDGAGGGKLKSLFLFFQGLPIEEIHPSLHNMRGEAINLTSSFRWDTQKRRIFAQLSGPIEHGADYRWELTTDLRDENWALVNGFEGSSPVLASFNMRSEIAVVDLASHASGRFGWTVGAEGSHRNFRNVEPGTILTPQILGAGYQLKQTARLTATLWRLPERRFIVDAKASSDAARLWAQPGRSFEKLTGSLGWHWFPQAEGGDYETSQQVCVGKTFGQPPFDELFILGLARDNDLPMRGHIGTRDGRKGSAPLGRNYFLENWEINKNVYSNRFITVQLGPIFDVGKITDPGTELGSHKWLFDIGAQAKVRAFGTGLAFSYGKDLRSGNNAFYVTVLK
jgi:hypothetical protein